MCDEQCTLMLLDASSYREDDIVKFLCAHGVLKSTINCHRCGNETSITTDVQYNCRKMIKYRKQKPARCETRVTARKGSFLERAHLKLKDLWRLVAVLLHMKPPRQIFLKEELGLQPHTIVDWYSFCREVSCSFILLRNLK
jgi:hypothetical protein